MSYTHLALLDQVGSLPVHYCFDTLSTVCKKCFSQRHAQYHGFPNLPCCQISFIGNVHLGRNKPLSGFFVKALSFLSSLKRKHSNRIQEKGNNLPSIQRIIPLHQRTNFSFGLFWLTQKPRIRQSRKYASSSFISLFSVQQF